MAFPAAAPATFSGRDGRLAAVYTVWSEDICGPIDSHTCEQAHERLMTMGTNGERKQLVDRCVNCRLSRLAWSPTLRRIAWSRGDSALFIAMAPGARPARIPYAQGHDPTWRPDGSGLAFSTPAGKVATVDRSGTPVNVADGSRPAWCRGDTIAFVAYDDWLMSVWPDGTRLGRLPRGAYSGPPDCSPDGRHVLFQTRNHIYVTPLAGGPARRIPGPARAETPVWSPSGRRIAWSDGHDIWIARANGTHARKVTRNRHRGVWQLPSWGPA